MLPFAEMVIVNFKVVTGSGDSAATGPGKLGKLVGALEGRVAETFLKGG